MIEGFTMQTDIDLILRLEKLAHLQLEPDERVQMAADLQKMIGMVQQLQSLDTNGVPPLIYLGMPDRELREDKIGDQLSTEAALSNAPDREGPYFKAPKVSVKPGADSQGV